MDDQPNNQHLAIHVWSIDKRAFCTSLFLASSGWKRFIYLLDETGLDWARLDLTKLNLIQVKRTDMN